MWLGRIIGVWLGFVTLGFFGAILGYLVGGMFDRGLMGNLTAGGWSSGFGGPSADERAHIEGVFIKTVFSLMGYLAKADGRVSEEEVAHTEAFMDQLGLIPERRRDAIALFQAGAAADYSPNSTLHEFQAVCGAHRNLRQMVMVYLVGVALADGNLDPAELERLRDISAQLGYSAAAFEQLMRMIQAQDHFSHQQYTGGQGSSASDLSAAYEALGVAKEATDKELKRAYRKLMSEYHPDKLIGQGLPEDMIKVATERSQEVQSAYDLISRARKAG